MSLLIDRSKEAGSEAKLTQQALRRRVGVPQSTIGALETGEHKTARSIAEIAAALGVEPLGLSSGKGPKRTDGTRATSITAFIHTFSHWLRSLPGAG